MMFLQLIIFGNLLFLVVSIALFNYSKTRGFAKKKFVYILILIATVVWIFSSFLLGIQSLCSGSEIERSTSECFSYLGQSPSYNENDFRLLLIPLLTGTFMLVTSFFLVIPELVLVFILNKKYKIDR